MNQIARIGLDIAKRWFQIHAVDENGREVLNRKLPRDKVLGFLAALPACDVALEACSSYHLRLITSVGCGAAVEIGVDERLVDKLPKMLGRLKLGAMGRLKDETKAVGNSQVFGSMPAGVVELKHDALCGAGPDRFGEVGENEREHLFGDRVGEAPHSSTRFGLDKARHIEPFEPMMAEGDRPLADRRPDSARDRLQAKAMFVHRPELDFGIRVFALLVGGRRLELFLSASRSSSSAVSG